MFYPFLAIFSWEKNFFSSTFGEFCPQISLDYLIRTPFSLWFSKGVRWHKVTWVTMLKEFHANGDKDSKKNNPSPRYLPKKNETLHLHKHLHANVLSSTLYNSSQLETVYRSIIWWLDEQNVYIHTVEYNSMIKKNGLLIYPTMLINSKTSCEVKGTRHKRSHIICSLSYEIFRKGKYL